MELAALEVKLLARSAAAGFARAELSKVLHCFGNHFSPQLHDHTTSCLAADADIEVDTRLPSYLTSPGRTGACTRSWSGTDEAAVLDGHWLSGLA